MPWCLSKVLHDANSAKSLIRFLALRLYHLTSPSSTRWLILQVPQSFLQPCSSQKTVSTCRFIREASLKALLESVPSPGLHALLVCCICHASGRHSSEHPERQPYCCSAASLCGNWAAGIVRQYSNLLSYAIVSGAEFAKI